MAGSAEGGLAPLAEENRRKQLLVIGEADFLARVGKYKSASIDHCKAVNDSMLNSEGSARNLKEKVRGEARFLARVGKYKSASIDHCRAVNDSMLNSEGSARNLKEKVRGEVRFLAPIENNRAKGNTISDARKRCLKN